jgi:DNA-directed RNA polymerase subunit H (RpoH/RPB5)
MATTKTKTSKTAVEEDVVNVFESKLVPKARVLSEEEAKEMLKKFNIHLRDLPKILGGDPVCKKIGAVSGQVVEFTRDAELYGHSKYFRLVVGGA